MNLAYRQKYAPEILADLKDLLDEIEERGDLLPKSELQEAITCNHSIFRHDNFIGCFSADKIKMPARKYFCFNIPVYKNMVEEPSCRSPYHKEYIRTGASGNPEDLCH